MNELSNPALSQARTSREADEPSNVSAADKVREVLRQSPYQSIRQLSLDYHEGILVIRGSLPSFYLKQLVQTLAQQVDGIEEIVNRVEVNYRHE